jgi:L-alanine-DL-glutamate epimerase-like enolase superfamily enzyme
LKIQQIETYSQNNLSLVRVTTDDGSTGWGQIAPFNADISAIVLHRQISAQALGQNAFEISSLVDRILEATYKFPGSYICRVLTGLETALWDLRGKIEDQSVCELIGGTPGLFPVYGSSMRRDIQPKDEAERLMRLRDQYGYQAFKIRVGSVCGHDQDQWEGRTETLVPTVRRRLARILPCWLTVIVAIHLAKQSKSVRCWRTIRSAILKNLALIGSWSGQRK